MEDPVDIYTVEYLRERINKESYDFIATLDDKPIGFCSIYNLKDRTGEISILIGNKETRGKGYGEEMLKELCNYGFRIYRLKELFVSFQLHHNVAYEVFARARGIPWDTYQSTMQSQFRGLADVVARDPGAVAGRMLFNVFDHLRLDAGRL
ncbi:MAG TPA: GNAT family N-acetyltransferase, partial [Halobacteria archaeon]|nr:GNAT family N-acetyltransferase [Halobacteria archaeon]